MRTRKGNAEAHSSSLRPGKPAKEELILFSLVDYLQHLSSTMTTWAVVLSLETYSPNEGYVIKQVLYTTWQLFKVTQILFSPKCFSSRYI